MDPLIIGSAISAGSSLLGSLFNKGPDPKKTSPGDAFRSEFGERMRQAERHGISKLAMIGAPSASPFVNVGASDGIGSTLASMGQDVGRVVAAGQTDAERKLTQLALDKAALENDFLRTQILSSRARLIRESAPPVPAVARPGLIPEKVKLPERTVGVNMGVGVPTNPYFSDAQIYEDRYGELGGSLAGLMNYPADWLYNWYKNFRPSVKRYPKLHQVYRGRHR